VSEGAITAALVIEVQLGPDPDKRWTWPAYLANLRRRLQRDALLLVVATDATVAAWAETPIAMGQPGWVLRPLVLGPSAVPIVTDPAEAARAPELAVVSVLAHRLEPCVVEIARASLEASRALDDERSRLYVDLVFAALPEAARAALEAWMASGTYEYQSDFAKRYVAQGEAKGEAKGRAEALLAVLGARGIEVSEERRIRILACTQLPMLDGWLVRAATARSAAEVFGE